MRLSPMCPVVRCSTVSIFRCPQWHMYRESMLTLSQDMTNMRFWKWL